MEKPPAPVAARSPISIGWSGWKAILARTAKAMADTDTSLRCAGVAFFGFLSIFPAIAIVVLLVGLLADRAFLSEQIARVEIFLPDIVTEVLIERLEILIAQPRAGLGIGLAISVVVALWSGSRGMDALIHTATIAHHETDKRGFVTSVALSIVATLAGSLFLIVSLTLIAAVPAIAQLSPIPGSGEPLAMVLRWPFLLVVAMTGISLLYRYTLARRPPKARWIWPGALLASVLWLGTSVLFSLYVENLGNFEASFGSLTAAVVLLLWLYISAMILVLGATLNAEIELQTEADSTIGPDRPSGKRGAYVADHVAD